MRKFGWALLAAATLLVGCENTGNKNESEIDDANVTAAAESIGDDAADMAALEADASEVELQGEVTTLGGNLNGIVGQHMALAVTASMPTLADELARQFPPPESGTLSFDGTNLEANVMITTSNLDYTYVAELAFADNDDGGKTIDGYFDFDYTISAEGVDLVYTIEALFNGVATDADGCTSAGDVSITYSLENSVSSLANQDGSLTITWSACDTLTVTGS